MAERLSKPTESARRIATIVNHTKPVGPLRRWFGFHAGTTRDRFIHYDTPEGRVSLATDYGTNKWFRNLVGMEGAKWGLKIRGGDDAYTRPKDIESLLAQFGSVDAEGRTEAQRIEALLLHRSIMHGEANRKIRLFHAAHVEGTIANAYDNHVQTIARGENDQNGRIYFPYLPRYPKADEAKMIRVVTDTPLEELYAQGEDYAVNRARLLVTIPQVAEAIKKIKSHAVSLIPGTDQNGEYITVTDHIRKSFRIDLHSESEPPIKPVEQAKGGFDSEIAKAYAESRHGVDAVLLDPYLEETLTRFVPHSIVTDVGIGAAPVAIEAIKKGATKVYGLDNSDEMIEQAQIAIADAGIDPQSIDITVGSAEHLHDPLDRNKFQNNSANLVLSVNVGCTVTSDIFGSHFSEMARIVTPDGRIFVTAPTTFAEVFTSGEKTKSEVLEDIGTKLLDINTQTASADNDTKIQALRKIFNTVGEINRATFVQRNGKFVLVYDGTDAPEILTSNDLVIREAELVIGEPIERKLAGSGAEQSTGLVVPNYYHPRSEYLKAIQRAGLTIENGEPIHKVLTQEELDSYNATIPATKRRLGQEYLANSPFDIYLLTK